MKEYLKYSPDLTIQEKELWHDYLKFVFLDEALWLINEDLELLNTGGTENENQKTFENQKNFLLNLLNIEIEKYSLG